MEVSLEFDLSFSRLIFLKVMVPMVPPLLHSLRDDLSGDRDFYFSIDF